MDGGWKDVVTLWDAESGELFAYRVSTRTFPDPPGLISPDGRLLARQYYDYSAGAPPAGKTIMIDPAFTGRGGIRWNPPDDLSPHSLFTPDGQTLITLTTRHPPANETGAAMGPSSIRLWEVRSGRQRLEFTLPFTVPALGKAARFEPLALAVSRDSRFLASAWSDNVIRLWDLANGTEVATRSGYWGRADTLTFRPDGRALASGHQDGTALVWDLSGLPEVKPAATDRESAWKDLASADAEKAYRAILALAADPDAAAFLRDRVRPVPAIPEAQFQKLVNDLDSDKYATRETATAALKKLGELVEVELQTLLRGDLSAEQRRRIADVLESQQLAPESDPERLRTLRCVEVLERIGSAEARALLGELAKGAPSARLTRDAAMAVRRSDTHSR
jgi:WD40 repeat protein